MIKAGPVFEQKQIRFSASSLDISFFSYSETAVFVPKGNPKRQPDKKAAKLCLFIFNALLKGVPKIIPRLSKIFQDSISSFKTRKGKREGIAFVRQTEIPIFTDSEARTGDFSRKKNRNTVKNENILNSVKPFVIVI